MGLTTYIPDGTRILHNAYADFVAREIGRMIHIVQYDKSMPILAVHLYKDGQPYYIPIDAESNIRLAKPDGTFVINPALGYDSARHILYFEITRHMTSVSGRIDPVIDIEYSDGTAATSSIGVTIDRNPVQDSMIESTTEYKSARGYAKEAVDAAAQANASRAAMDEYESYAEEYAKKAIDAATQANASRAAAGEYEAHAETDAANAKDAAERAEQAAKRTEELAKSFKQIDIYYGNANDYSYKGVAGGRPVVEFSPDYANDIKFPADYEGLLVLFVGGPYCETDYQDAVLMLDGSYIFYNNEYLKSSFLKAGSVLALRRRFVYGGGIGGASWEWDVVSILNGTEGSGILWSGALFEGGTVKFDVPRHYVQQGHLDLVIDSFLPDTRAVSKSVIVSLFFDKLYDEYGNMKYPYMAVGNPVMFLRRCDVTSYDGDTDDMLRISGLHTKTGSGAEYVNSYEIEIEYLPTSTPNAKPIFNRISAYAPRGGDYAV